MKQQTKLVGEFVLIVVGVLVALAVETALEDRHDAGLRDEYIARIKADVEADKRAIANRVEFFTSVQQFCNDVLYWLKSDAPVDQQVVLASFYAAEVWPFVPSSDTYQDLQNTGNIRLLDDIDLRTNLSAYYNKAKLSQSGWDPTEDYRAIIRGIIPNDVQRQIRENCPTTEALDQTPTGFPPCQLPDVDYELIARLFSPLKDDLTLYRTLTYRESEVGVMVYLLQQQLKLADDVLRQIG